MGVLTIAQVAQLVWDHGLRDEAAAIAVAVSQAESGFSYDVVGDWSLMKDHGGSAPADQGPSIGLWQILSYKSAGGQGGNRDGAANFDPNHNASAMVAISDIGTGWSPWTTYRYGLHTPFLPSARGAIADVAAGRGASIPPLTYDPHFATGGKPSQNDLLHAVGVDANALLNKAPGGWTGFVNSTTDLLGSVPGAGVVKNAAGAVTGAVSSTADALGAVGSFLSHLMDPKWWARIGVGAAGLALLALGFLVIFRKPVEAAAVAAAA